MRWVQLCSSVNILLHCLSLELEWKLTFSSPVATAEFSKFAGILSAAEYIMWNAGLDKSQARIKIARRNINNLKYVNDNTLMAESEKWRGTKEPLDEGKRGEWKAWLKIQHSKNWDHGIQSHHFTVNRWGKHGNSDRLYFGGKWQPTPMLLPGESQGWGSLVGCHLWSRTELDTTEVT